MSSSSSSLSSLSLLILGTFWIAIATTLIGTSTAFVVTSRSSSLYSSSYSASSASSLYAASQQNIDDAMAASGKESSKQPPSSLDLLENLRTILESEGKKSNDKNTKIAELIEENKRLTEEIQAKEGEYDYKSVLKSQSLSKSKKKVIVDTDSGWDDALSLVYLMKNPEIEIVGVTVTGCGETNLRWGTLIAQTLLEVGCQTQATIAIGTSTPLWEPTHKHVFPQTFKDDNNDLMGLLGSLNPEITIGIDPRPAWHFIAETLDNSQEPITILALGGFTNLAKMLTLYPNTDVQNIQEVFAMAGAVWVDGNLASINDAKEEWGQGLVYSTNRHAEWNIFVDPLAAKIVFDSEIPLTLVPMDACLYVTLDPDQIATITATDTLAQLAKNIMLKKTGDHSESIHPVAIFDPLATVIMTGGLINYQTHTEYLDVDLVETETDNQCGKVKVMGTGSRRITVVQGVSATGFAAGFTEVLNS